MTDLKLLEAQQRLLTQLQKEARERGETREPKPTDFDYGRSFFPRNDYVRTFEQWNRQQNKAMTPYPWTKGMGPYG